MPSVGFEPTISAGERSQTHALDRAAHIILHLLNMSCSNIKVCLRTERVPLELCLEYMRSWICIHVHCDVGGELH